MLLANQVRTLAISMTDKYISSLLPSSMKLVCCVAWRVQHGDWRALDGSGYGSMVD